MLPKIDVITLGASDPQAPRPESERAVDAYKKNGTEIIARTDFIEKRLEAAKEAETAKSGALARDRKDKVELNLTLSREEREAFATAFSGHAKEMTPEEKSVLEQAAERLSAFIEEAITKNADNRERVEKAVSEWYSRLSRGEPRTSDDLIRLLRQAAMGDLDDLNI